MNITEKLHKYMIHIVFFLILISGYLGLYYHNFFVSLKWSLPIAFFFMLLKPMVFMNIKKAFTEINPVKTKYLVTVTILHVGLFPLLTYLFMKSVYFLFPNLDSRIIAALVIMGLSPIASSAPAFVGISEGKVQLTLVGLIWTFLLSLIVIPFYSYFMLNSIISVPIMLLFNSILWYIIIPLIIGQSIKYIVYYFQGGSGLESLKTLYLLYHF